MLLLRVQLVDLATGSIERLTQQLASLCEILDGTARHEVRRRVLTLGCAAQGKRRLVFVVVCHATLADVLGGVPVCIGDRVTELPRAGAGRVGLIRVTIVLYGWEVSDLRFDSRLSTH